MCQYLSSCLWATTQPSMANSTMGWALCKPHFSFASWLGSAERKHWREARRQEEGKTIPSNWIAVQYTRPRWSCFIPAVASWFQLPAFLLDSPNQPCHALKGTSSSWTESSILRGWAAVLGGLLAELLDSHSLKPYSVPWPLPPPQS